MGRVSTKVGTFLKDAHMFDHVEFGVSSRDARAMAPSTRLLIQLSFMALLDSGIDYRSRNVGCYMSAVEHDIASVADMVRRHGGVFLFAKLNVLQDEYEPTGSTANLPCMVANRVSQHLDLLGPSVPVDTACSSSLTAMHLAVQALRQKECEAAIVGGCQLNHKFVSLSSNGSSPITYKRLKIT